MTINQRAKDWRRTSAAGVRMPLRSSMWSAPQNPERVRRSKASEELRSVSEQAWRICRQRFKDKRRLYALHAPEVECIGKGKAHHLHEFGVKISLAFRAKQGLIVGARSFPANSYDGHSWWLRSSRSTSCRSRIYTAHHGRTWPSPSSSSMVWVQTWHRCRLFTAVRPSR